MAMETKRNQEKLNNGKEEKDSHKYIVEHIIGEINENRNKLRLQQIKIFQ